MRTVLPLVVVTCAVFTHPVVIAFEDVDQHLVPVAVGLHDRHDGALVQLGDDATVIAAQLCAGANGAVTTTRRPASAAGATVGASRFGAGGVDCAEVTMGAIAATRPSGSTRRGIVMRTF